jgi:hypothetical protein
MAVSDSEHLRWSRWKGALYGESGVCESVVIVEDDVDDGEMRWSAPVFVPGDAAKPSSESRESEPEYSDRPSYRSSSRLNSTDIGSLRSWALEIAYAYVCHRVARILATEFKRWIDQPIRLVATSGTKGLLKDM